MPELLISFLLYIAFFAFSMKRLMMYLHALQQEDYYAGRLASWMWKNKVIDKRLSAFLILAGIAGTFLPAVFTNALAFAGFAFVTFKEMDPRKTSKKKLALTARAKRILTTAAAPLAIFGLLGFLLPSPFFWLICVQLIPVFLILATLTLQPIEEMIQLKYLNEAKQKLAAINPTVIGITGSFGKTSVKHILGHILKTQDSTLITPGSVNTPMGVTRIIREDLDEGTKYFVVEMGAYGSGSIKRMCGLTPPDIGVITAIGHAHYERFKSLNTVAETKYELAEAALAKNGQVIVHEKTLHFDYTHKMKEEHKSAFIVCGEPPPKSGSANGNKSYITKDDLQISKIEQDSSGLTIEINWRGQRNLVSAPLFGLHHGHNIALAYAAARALGIEPAAIGKALKTLPQIPHRLEVIKMPDGTTLIDDAYNSNPLGFRSALDLLSMINKKGRKILVTPGIVELGAKHDDVHEKLGIYAAQVCDIVIAVCPERIPTFIKGVESGGKKPEQFATFKEAQKWLGENKQDGDVILLENDLPDLYERVPKV